MQFLESVSKNLGESHFVHVVASSHSKHNDIFRDASILQNTHFLLVVSAQTEGSLVSIEQSEMQFFEPVSKNVTLLHFVHEVPSDEHDIHPLIFAAAKDVLQN